MVKQIRSMIVICIMLAIALNGCGGSADTPSDDHENTGGGLPPAAAVKAQEALSAELNVSIDKIVIVSQEQVTWLDSCLGLGGIAESCLRTDVPGWLVELSVDDQSYKARTDALGEQVRFES